MLRIFFFFSEQYAKEFKTMKFQGPIIFSYIHENPGSLIQIEFDLNDLITKHYDHRHYISVRDITYKLPVSLFQETQA